ncbi:MAG TPA: hypothetical protein VFC07_15185 [Verrucomicrobiae bacterium]|nr:hypothetical protein [Verrucomicrobiae bacterium]
MKRLLFTSLLTLALGRVALGGPGPIYKNTGSLIAPSQQPIPQVDDLVFWNTSGSLFEIALPFGNFTTPVLYGFSDVLNYTNQGTMICNNGFNFNSAPSSNGVAHAAASFLNSNQGIVSVGSLISTNSTIVSSIVLSSFPELLISVTNMTNAGVLDVGPQGLINLTGVNLNLQRGTIHAEGFDDSLIINTFGGVGVASLFNIGNVGIFDEYWGIGLQTNVAGNFKTGQSPVSAVTFAAGVQGFPAFVAPPFPLAFANTNMVNQSNFTYQVVFVNTNIGLSTDVRFEPASDFATPIIQWLAVTTNAITGLISTNTLYLSDTFGSLTNFQLITNETTLTGVFLKSPFNYTFEAIYGGTLPNYTNLPSGDTPYLTNNIFGPASSPETNQYTAFGVTLAPVSVEPDPTLSYSQITNLPGRIALNASNYLDLSYSKVTGANYLTLSSTNHFAGSPFAQIDPPFMDINLGTTNGQLNITNLVPPYLPRFDGTIEVYSARWTNITKAGITNAYHVLIVDSEFAPISPVYVENFLVRSTNAAVSDQLNVLNSILVNAQSLTVTSNGPSAPTPFGQLNLLAQNILWSSSLPVLQTLTNSGIITVPDAAYFLGVRQPPYYANTFDEPYQAFVNHGSIATSGNTIWSSYFENTGFGPLVYLGTNNVLVTNIPGIFSTFGSISLQANNAVLANSEFAASSGDVMIAAGSLSVSNHALLASGALTLFVTNGLNFTTNGSGAVWTNFWFAGNGFNLPIKPVTGDLLGTSVMEFCPGSYAQTANTWAGLDFGASATGFTNNAAVGQLILDGADTTSSFFFTGTGAANAMYVDQIQLLDGATNITNPSIGYTAFAVDTNMMIYFADAVAGTLDISERLDGGAGGRLRWVPGYAGLFSGTNVTLGGKTYPLINRALVTSKDIDSNGTGTNNYYQLQNGSYPIFTSANVNFTMARTNHLGTNSMVITWQSLSYSTNFLRYKTNLSSTNWLTLTNFVQGPANGKITVFDPVQGNSKKFYKVEIDPQQPY